LTASELSTLGEGQKSECASGEARGGGLGALNFRLLIILRHYKPLAAALPVELAGTEYRNSFE
jgi:hypothetical protein